MGLEVWNVGRLVSYRFSGGARGMKERGVRMGVSIWLRHNLRLPVCPHALLYDSSNVSACPCRSCDRC